jgi:hypothetical protein
MAESFLKSSRSFDEVISAMAQKTIQVRAVRGFVLAGNIIEPGKVVEVTLVQARELVAAHQAERINLNDPANKAASEALTTRGAPALVNQPTESQAAEQQKSHPVDPIPRRTPKPKAE